MRFVRKSKQSHARTADLVMVGNVWEMEARRSSSIGTAQPQALSGTVPQHHLRFLQDNNGTVIERELRKLTRELSTLNGKESCHEN